MKDVVRLQDAGEPTVTEAVAAFRTAGFRNDFLVDRGMLRCAACGEAHPPRETGVEQIHRVEGSSDPGDEAAVFALAWLHCGVRGVLVTAYGPTATEDEAAVVTALVDRRSQTRRSPAFGSERSPSAHSTRPPDRTEHATHAES